MTRGAALRRGPMTREAFLALSPRARGYAVYMFGAREDEPHVPEEKNPYPAESPEAAEWDAGALRACLDVLDADDE